MSEEHLSAELLERYRGRRLPAGELLSVDDHLAACGACRQRVGQGYDPGPALASLRATLNGTAEGDHLSYEDLVAHVDGLARGAERDITVGHLEFCSQCADEVRALESLRLPSPPARVPAMLVPLAAALFVGLGLWALWEGRPVREKAVAEGEGGTRLEPVFPRPVPEEPAIVLDAGGEEVRVGPTGLLAGLEWLPSRSRIAEALLSRRLERPSVLARLAPVEGRLLGENDGGPRIALLRPMGAVCRDTRPTLVWRPLAKAESYSVAVFDREFREAARSGALVPPQWTVTPALRRGTDYSWEVTARVEGREVRSPRPPDPEARFRVLDEASEEELRLVEARQPRSHLALGVLYARAGLRPEAEAELRALVAANPGAREAAELLASVRSWPTP